MRIERIGCEEPRISISMPILDGMYALVPMTAAAINTLHRLTEIPHELICVYHDESDSIASAHNEAFSLATGNLLCCVHNDTFVEPRWEKPLVSVAEAGDIAFPMIDETDCEAKPNEPWMTSSSCFMLSRDLFERLGGYDEGFVGIHYEDWDLFMRAKQAGAKLVRCPSRVRHLRSVTRLHGDLERERRYFCVNEERYREKHAHLYGGKMPIPVLSEQPEEARP